MRLKGETSLDGSKKSTFLLHKLLLQLFKDMLLKFQNEIPISSDDMSTKLNTGRFSAFFFQMRFSRNDFFSTCGNPSSKIYRRIDLCEYPIFKSEKYEPNSGMMLLGKIYFYTLNSVY